MHILPTADSLSAVGFFRNGRLRVDGKRKQTSIDSCHLLRLLIIFLDEFTATVMAKESKGNESCN